MPSLDLNPRQGGKQHWRSLEALGEAPEFLEFLEREFPEGASELGSGVSRRKFLQVMGAGMALAGVSGCNFMRRPEFEILPYNKMPENLVPGMPQFYATNMAVGGEAVGLLVESHEGRPTKVEGNPNHPASLGATGRLHQASVLDLYDPDRSRTPLRDGAASTWEAFWAEMEPVFAAHAKGGGRSLRFLGGYSASPSFAAVKRFALEKFPECKWTAYEPVNGDYRTRGLKAVTGQVLEPFYRMQAARRVFSVDCDFTDGESNHLVHARHFAHARNPDLGAQGMNRLYAVESHFSTTGAHADHRLRVKPGRLLSVLILAARECMSQGLSLGVWASDVAALSKDAAAEARAAGINPEWMRAMCADLMANQGSSLVLAGKYQPPLAHALAHVLNVALGNVGSTVEYRPSQPALLNGSSSGEPLNSADALARLAEDLDAGAVETLVVLDANPAYDVAASLQLPAKLKKARRRIHLGTEVNETAALCAWHLPMSHYLEDWSDGLAADGTAGIAQPLISPMYATLGKAEFLAGISGYPLRKGHDIVKEYWRSRKGGADFEKSWRKWLHDGVIPGTATTPVNPSAAAGLGELARSYAPPKSDGIEIVFREHPNVLDGRFANNSWLQELPEPVSKITWDNAAYISPALAERLGLAQEMMNGEKTGTTRGDYRNRPMVSISVGERALEAVAWPLPGLADDTVLLHIGYGRARSGKVGTGAGFDAYSLMEASSPWFAAGARLEPTGKTYPVACTQDHWSMMGRPLARELPMEEYEGDKQESFSEGKWNKHPPEKSLWPEKPASQGGSQGTYDFSRGMQWGMVIDFNSCTGCNACIVACTAENNVPVVGKEQVMLGREMHWLRLDRYFSGDVENPEMVFQMITCMQCENAPCEEVCPVAATTHSHEGLNDMVYNRCVGTRYCSNNCPYKVRRFNFFNYTNKWKHSPEAMQKNPDVTVRFRGVMEKCTYCVQRINRARIQRKNQGKETIPDGMVTPACAQACPGQAIVFGDINDPESRVAKLKAHPRDYGLLKDLNTKPRTTYLGRVRNPNQAIENLRI